MTLNIVIVEPQIPQNTGNIARTCAATGARLHLVGPMAFKIDDKKLKRAGLDYWHMLDITFYDDINEFFHKTTEGQTNNPSNTPYKTCNNPCNNQNNQQIEPLADFYYFTTKAPRIYTEPEYKNNAYLLFGSETKGLDENLLYKNLERCVRFPMKPDSRSLNLSNAVAIASFEVLRQWNFPELQNHGKMAGILT
ncbi:MAG: tRNA (cytidine(34)-2'-O)-methyltransferase [Oscillospiraceae bacterium]|nr:tRNA (cytidine(34)-2'-O)-methyltransferase [Oscillospiraceae bacterium]